MCGFNFRCTNSSGAQRNLAFKRCAKIEDELPRTRFTEWQCRSSAVYYIARQIMT